MKKNILRHFSYVKLIRWWLMGILIFLPFQLSVAKSNILLTSGISHFLRYIDEITIIIFLPLAMIEFIRNKGIRDWLYLILLFPILGLFASGIISGIINSNSMSITIVGVLDYIRNFLVIFIYAAFFREVSNFKKIFQLLLIMAVFIGGIALLQEIWAITSHYYFEEINHSKIFLVLKQRLPDYSQYASRFGIYRMPSLMDNFIFLGLYCLLILTIYISTAKKVRFSAFLALFSGVFVSVSRMVYIGFMVISGLQILRSKRNKMIFILASIPILILMVKLSTLWDFNVYGRMISPQQLESKGLFEPNEENSFPYRKYSRDKAMQIWGDYPFWGVGPGKFGGIISEKFNSHIYEEYNFLQMAQLKRWKHIDQFWPMILAETGIIGTASLVLLFVSSLLILLIAQSRTTSDEIKGLFVGCRGFLIVVLIYSVGSPLNIAQVIFPFFAFIGMGLGCQKDNCI